MRWSYAITTTPKRRGDHFIRTLASLRAGGFDRPRIFVDGATFPQAEEYERTFGLEVTTRYPTIRTAGHWILTLYELYIREPTADRYAIFQDDMVTYKHLREYLEKSPYPAKGYCNLYMFPSNQTLAPPLPEGESKRRKGVWYQSRELESGPVYPEGKNQTGRGAVALVFNVAAVVALLSSEHMASRPQDPDKGWRKIDGGIVDSLNKAGFREYVHDPSLVQHTGTVSTMGSKPHKLAESFRGEEFSALDLLG